MTTLVEDCCTIEPPKNDRLFNLLKQGNNYQFSSTSFGAPFGSLSPLWHV
jgi:hypothetical protein